MSGTVIFRCLHSPLFQFILSREVAILGRSSQCEFVVPHPSVSRRHAEIVLRQAEVLVTDLGSQNGTFLDHVPVQRSAILHGQVLRFGSVSFTVLVEQGEGDFNLETPDPSKMLEKTRIACAEPHENLSKAQRKVFDLLLTGDPEKTIARRLELSQHTIHNHVRAIFRVFGVHSRAELYARLLEKNGNERATT